MILLPTIFALAHAYMGATLPGNIYPKRGRDQIAYAVMALCTAPVLGIWALAAFLCFWLMFAPSPARWLPWAQMPEWFPVGTLPERLKIAAKLGVRYAWGSIPLSLLYGLVAGSYVYAALPVLIGLAMGGGYLIGSLLQERGDKEGKLCSGALLGTVLAIMGAI